MNDQVVDSRIPDAQPMSKLAPLPQSGVMCREYADFRVSSDGEVQGVGLLIAQEPSSGRLVVLAPIRGGPADKAGVLPGDEVSFIFMLVP